MRENVFKVIVFVLTAAGLLWICDRDLPKKAFCAMLGVQDYSEILDPNFAIIQVGAQGSAFIVAPKEGKPAGIMDGLRCFDAKRRWTYFPVSAIENGPLVRKVEPICYALHNKGYDAKRAKIVVPINWD